MQHLVQRMVARGLFCAHPEPEERDMPKRRFPVDERHVHGVGLRLRRGSVTDDSGVARIRPEALVLTVQGPRTESVDLPLDPSELRRLARDLVEVAATLQVWFAANRPALPAAESEADGPPGSS